MLAGDILLFKMEKGLNKLILWGTNSKYSHVAICVSPDMNLAIEANTYGGIRAIDIRKISASYDVYRIKKAHSYNLDAVISYLVDKLNTRYDYLGVISLGLLKLLQKLGFPTKNYTNRFQKERDYFCSELCYEAFYLGGGLNIAPQIKEADIASPADIAKSPVVELIEER